MTRTPMHPILFHIPLLGFPIHTYGALIVLGFCAAMFLAARQARREGVPTEDVLDFGFWGLLGGMLGARAVFIAVNWEHYFVSSPWTDLGTLSQSALIIGFGVCVTAVGVVGMWGDEPRRGAMATAAPAIVAIGLTIAIAGRVAASSVDVIVRVPSVLVFWRGGLVFYGAALGGFIAFVLFARARGLRGAQLLRLADILIVGLPLASALGRLGCVSAGCCWGAEAFTVDAEGQFHATAAWTIQFPEGALAYDSLVRSTSPAVADAMRSARATGPLLPIQLIDAAGEIGLFLLLLIARARKSFHGQVLLTWALVYPLWRSTLEVFRGDGERGYVVDGVLSTSQAISIAVALVALIALLVLRRRARRSFGSSLG